MLLETVDACYLTTSKKGAAFGRLSNIERWGDLCYNLPAALLHTGNRKEVCGLEILTSFLVSLAAGIVGYFVCKWLDRHRKGK